MPSLGTLTSDDLSGSGERSGQRRVYCDGRLGVRRFDCFFSIKQDKPYQDRQGNWKQAWPHYVKGNEQKVCAITDKFVEEPSEGKWEDGRGKIPDLASLTSR